MAKRPKKKRGQDWDRNPATLAGRITTCMEERKLSPSDLANACGISVTAVGWWLRGETKNIKLEHFFRIADMLNVEPRWLGINEGPKQISAVLNEARNTLDRIEHSLRSPREYSPPAGETTRVTESAQVEKRQTAFKKS